MKLLKASYPYIYYLNHLLFQILMKNRILLLVVAIVVMLYGQTNAQLTGVKTIPGTYATVALAINDLNTQGVGAGGVTFNIAAGYTENITSQLTITATGSAGNVIIFQKSGAGANPKITRTDAGSNATSAFGGLGDAVVRIDGTDFITFDGVDLGATDSGIEYGYFTFKPSVTDGCQDVTIKNCEIGLTKGTSAYVIGIYISNGPTAVSAATGVTVTATSGINQNIIITGNTVKNVHSGIHVRGSSATGFYDSNVIVGQAAASNVIKNFGGGSVTTSYGVFINYVSNPTVTYNTINNALEGTNHASTLYGIYYSSVLGDLVGSNNTINLSNSSTSACQWIYNASAVNSENINSNVFSAGTFAATSTSYFIYSSNSTQNKTISGNVTSGTINKTGAGTLYGYYNFGSPSGGTATISNNNFSNISLTGASLFYGIYQATSTTQIEKIQNNTITNVIGGTSAVYGINLNYGAVGSEVSGNIINTLSCSSTIYGLWIGATASGSLTIFNNTINGISTTGASLAAGIVHASGTNSNIYNNKIYDIQSNNATGSAYGLQVSGGVLVNVYNNLIGDIRTPLANAAIPLAGIYVSGGTTVNLYFNTVYLNGTSSGALFGSAAIYASTTPVLTMRNNIFVNLSTPFGATGYTAAYRRSSTTLTSYTTASNNNIFYAGTPSTTNVIFFDGTTAQSTLADYKALVAPRDALSGTENVAFLSTSGSNANFLHINPAIATQVESGATNVVGITDDFDGNLRNVSTPDIGADEGTFILLDINPPSITYSPLQNSCTPGQTSLIATIIDPSGVPTSGIGLPVLYWSINAIGGPFTAATGVSIGSNQYQFNFGVGSVLGDIIYYYIVAQDMLAVPNVGAFPGGGAGGFTANPPTASTPPTTPSSYTVIPVLSGTYTVGVMGNYPTLTNAVTAYNNSCVAGSVVFELIDATYSTSETFPINIGVNPSASAVNNLTIRPAASNSVMITGSSATSILTLNGADYVTIDGSNSGGLDRSLSIVNTAATTNSAVIWVASLGNDLGATHNTLKNLNITAGEVGTTTSINTFGIFVAGTTISNTGSGSDNDHLTIQNNLIKKARYAIYGKAAAVVNSINNLQILDNIIGATDPNEYVTYRGIEIAYADEPVISGNLIFNLIMALSANNAGIDCGAGINNGTIVGNNISGVYAESTNGWGAYGINFSSAVSTSNNLIANNFISDIKTVNYSSGSTTYNAFGIRLVGGTGTKVFNNSINISGNVTIVSGTPTQPNSAAFIVTSTDVSNLQVKNNIFRNTQTFISGTPKIYSIWLPSSYTGLAGIDNNDYFGTDGPSGNPTTYHVGRVGTTDYTTLAAWQGFTGQDANSENVNPVFTSNTDLHLVAGSNPLLEGGGVSVPEVTDDIDGNNRPNPPTIGAHELNPASPCPQLSIAPPNVNITNSACQSGCIVEGGLIEAPSNSPCPEGSTLQYQVNGGEWTTTLPEYLQEGPDQTIKTRCSCDEDPMTVSPESNPLTTEPGTCDDPDSPFITIIDNICPSTEGSISADGCDPGTILEWTLVQNGPWSETVPEYTTESFTVYARCTDQTTGCISEVTSEITAPETCESEPECPEEAKLVISQVYGGGGNSGATYTHDFVEIFNAGNVAASLNGLSLQYASATGTGNFGSSGTQLTELPDVSLLPGQYFLVQQAGGANGIALPTPDYIDPTPINMSGTSGKIALVTGITSLGCNGGSAACDQTQLDRIIDLVGFGAANFYEGSGPAPTLSNTTAAFRAFDGCLDTDDNFNDFFADVPAPRNTASPIHSCGIESPEIIIVDNECPSTEGSITAEGCGEAYNLEWALSENGPWSENAPEYTIEPMTVYARCTDGETNCSSPVVNATTDPTDCSVFECAITSIIVDNISECNDNETVGTSDDFFTADITVNYVNYPEVGSLVISGDAMASESITEIGETSHTFIGVIMSADGGSISLTAGFTAEMDCTLTNENAGTAPNSCSAEPTIVNYGGPTIEDPCVCAGDGLFDEEVVITANPGDVWTIFLNTGYLDPLTGDPFPVGTPFIVNPSDPTQYTLVGQHVDGVGYTLTAASLTDTLTISNLCNYPDEPIVDPTITVCQGGSTLIEPESTGGGMGGDCNATVDLIITGVIDGPLTGGIPKAVEFYVVNDIPDLSLYGFGSANNGGGTDGQEFTFPAGAATAGTHLWVATEATAFTSFFGFAPSYIETNASNINGDDAIELFFNGSVIDVFGNINVDGTGTAWDYEDGWVYRINDTGEDGTTFVLSNWTFSGPNALDGTTSNSSANNPMPIGTYTCQLADNPVMFNFYADANLNTLLAGPAFSYNPNTTPANSPQTIWVTSIDPDTGCESEPVTVVITVVAPPVVNAGNNQAFCGLPTFVNISATSTVSGTWSTPNGGGLIQNPGLASTRYYPVTADIGKTVILTWTTSPNHICGSISDQMGILIVPETPDAEFAYPQDEYCETFVDPTPVHTTGVDGIYTYEVVVDGPILAIDRNTGIIDMDNSDWGTYDVTNTVQGCGNLIITGVLDGNLPGQLPKFVEFYALADIVDLSKYGFSSANNGAGSTNAPEFTFPAVSVDAGTFIWVATEVTAFTQFFGFPPTYTSLASNINGDDAIELFCNGQVIDVFGDVTYAAGTNLPWNYSDGWAYRKNNTNIDGTVYNPNNWNFSGVNVLTGITQNSLASSPFPYGSYTTTSTGLCPSNTHTVEITIGDSRLPEVVCPLNIHQALDPGLCSAWLFWEPPVVTDNCPGEPVITQISGPASGSEFTLKNSPYTIEYEIYDANGNGPVFCSFTVRVTGFAEPTSTLACNDEVQISLDKDCTVTLNPDMFLEGGPYSCYNVFELYVNAAGYEDQNLTNLKVHIEPGTYMVTILDPLSGNNCMTTMVLKDKIAPTIECTTCPEGGIVGYGMPVSEYEGILSLDDYDILSEIGACWNFDFGPLAGVHPIDVYKITVDVTGAYNFAVISSWADAELAIYDQEIDPNNMCNGVIGGGNDNGPGFDPIASVVLTAGQTYYIAVSNYSSTQNGTYTLSMNGDVGNVLHLDLPIYDPACTFAGCNPSIYTFPLPEVDENCGYTLSYEDQWVDGPYCGIYFLRRTYTATDHAGMSASCTMEYLFTGSGLEDVVWPRNWDGITNNNPMLECSATFPKDQYGNPHPNYTGWPSGYDKSCDRIEVFYTDRVYASDCGPKILRDWVVIDDCWGLIEEWTQIIRIVDSTPPKVCGPDDILVNNLGIVSTNGWTCTGDLVVPKPLICDNCDEDPGYSVSATAGTVVYVPATKTWVVFGLPKGIHTITYTVFDWCGNSSEHSFNVEVYDGIPPTPVCEQYKQVSLTFDGISSSAKVWANSFDSGSHDSGCGPVWFKVLRTDGGCMSFNCDNTACTQQWFDDYVVYCCDDTGKEIMTTLRVFDVNPGPGPINPSRMLPGGDLYGRYNDCMTTVDVDEKVPPTLFCEDITITCEDNIHPDHTGYPTVLSACGNYELKWTDNLTTLNTCNVGYFIRKWEIFVNNVKRGECNQRIDVLETLPFDPLTIVFPYISQENCLKEEPIGGAPTWETNPCIIVDATLIRVDTFRFVEDACYKILREWAVVDWCTYKANTGAEWNLDEYRYISNNRRAILDPAKFSAADRDGYYRFTEVIMVYDNTPANIEVADVCLGVATCVTAVETHTITANSFEDDADCGGEYEWTYVVKDECCGAVIQYSANNNAYKGANYQGGVMGKASLDKLKESNASFRLLPSLPMGRYIVTWTLSDGCGNVVQADQLIEVVDKKAPTPFLVDISTAYMDNCMVEITAIIFDKKACDGDCLASYDNCSEILYFTFTPVLPKIDQTWVLDAYGLYYFNPVTGAKSTRAQYLLGNAHSWDPVKRTSGKVFGKFDESTVLLPVVLVDVYVWDQFALNEDCDDGNWDFATVTLILNDEGDDCGAGPGSLVSGTIKQAVTDQYMNNVEVLLDNGSPEYPWHADTEGGNYQFESVKNGEYWLSATKDDDHANGINTLDLIMIQRYLLGISSNWSVYNLIAADANESHHISGGDILALRNLILGKSEKLPGGRSWIFLDKGFEFTNPSLPWNELGDAEKLDVEVSTSIGGNDFVGIKIGDINMTAYANADDQSVEVRNIENFEIEIEDGLVKKGEVFELNFYNTSDLDLYGLQWTLGLDGVELIEVKEGLLDIREELIGRIAGDVVTMSWFNIDGVTGTEGNLLFSLKLRALKNINRGECVHINSDVTRAEAYVGKELNIADPVLGIRGRHDAFNLYQNEPNPFSNETVIGFDLPTAGSYTLKIVDVNGKLLKEIQSEGVKGYNKVTISNKDLISGILYYHFESGEHSGVRKMILVK